MKYSNTPCKKCQSGYKVDKEKLLCETCASKPAKDMTWKELFDKEFGGSHVWEDADNNKHSVVHDIKAFITKVELDAYKRGKKDTKALAINTKVSQH